MSTNNREVTLRFLAQPSDVNFGGNIHGGSAMKWLDEAGYACATGWSNSYCVTAFVGDINFHSSISVGNLVEIRAKIIHTGNSSMHIVIELYSCNPRNCVLSKAIHCIMVFVAVDEKKKPVKVPSWNPETEPDVNLSRYAVRIMELRKLNQEEFKAVK